MAEALRHVGVPGRSLRVVVGASGSVTLPFDADAYGGDGAVATARRVLRAATESQVRRQREGAAACEAVSRLGGAVRAAEKDRAKLCSRLHAREAAVLKAVLGRLEPNG